MEATCSYTGRSFPHFSRCERCVWSCISAVGGVVRCLHPVERCVWTRGGSGAGCRCVIVVASCLCAVLCVSLPLRVVFRCAPLCVCLAVPCTHAALSSARQRGDADMAQRGKHTETTLHRPTMLSAGRTMRNNPQGAPQPHSLQSRAGIRDGSLFRPRQIPLPPSALMSRRPNRGGGEQARALKAAAEKAAGRGKGGRRGGHSGGAGAASSDSTESGGRYVPSSLSTASVGYAASATGSSTVTFTPLSDSALAALAAAPAPANVYRQSVHGLPQAVEVSEEQLVSLRYAITATRVHDLTVQNQLMAGAIGGGGGGTQAAPLFGDAADAQPLFSDDAAVSAASGVPAPSPSPPPSSAPMQLAASVAAQGSLAWLQLQVSQTLSHYQFRRRLVKSVQKHVLTPHNLASSFASNRELMAQLQDFKVGPIARAEGQAAAQTPQELVGLIQRATQACIDWLLVHAPESDLPPAFALHAQPLQVVRLHDDDALALHSAAEDKIRYIHDLGLGFRRVDIVDAFRQIAGDLPELGAPASTASTATKVPLEALDENLVLWLLFDWFDLRTSAPPPSDALAAAAELSEEDRAELRENEMIVLQHVS